MYTLTVVFIALAHGIAGHTFEAANAGATTKFQTEDSCKAAGAIIYELHAAQVDAALKSQGLGVLMGGKLVCRRDGEQI